jgi:ATP-dependent 26S proteasome regulatory subunit
MLREELQLLQEQGSLVGEVVKAMDTKKVLVKVMHHVNGTQATERLVTHCLLGPSRRQIRRGSRQEHRYG